MKKIYSFVLVAMAAMAVNATDVVFDFTNPSSLNPAVIPSETASQGIQLGGNAYTAGDVTLTFAAPSSNGAKLWTNTNGTYELRFYQPNSFSISSKGENIKAVRFSFSDKGAITPATGEIDGTNTWLGDASEITFSIPDKGTASKIKTITVSIGEAPVISVDTLDVKAAVDLIKAAPGQKLTKDLCVRGRVIDINNSGATQYGNVDVYLEDINNTNDTIEAYRMKSYNGEKYSGPDDIQFEVGDTIIFFSSDWSYYTDGGVYEGFGCNLVEVVGGEKKPEYPVIFVTEAIALAKELKPEQGQTLSTDKKYEVRGYVVSISQKKENTFYMGANMDDYAEFQVYQYDSAEGVVEEGAYVSAVGYICNYYAKDGSYNSYEIKGGPVTVIWGAALENTKAKQMKAVKMFDGNQVIFKANGVKYNVLGNIVK